MGGYLELWCPENSNVVFFSKNPTTPTFGIYTPPPHTPKRKDPLFVHTQASNLLPQKNSASNSKYSKSYSCFRRVKIVTRFSQSVGGE